jgi:hypothetical protein
MTVERDHPGFDPCAAEARGETPVVVYGVDHSPWVQAVLLGLFDRQIPHSVITAPPWSVFRGSGVLMPAASVGGSPWMLQSGTILCELGYQAVSGDDMAALFGAMGGVVQRVDSGPEFWWAWSRVRDQHPQPSARLAHHFLRPFSVLYFHLLLARFARTSAPTSAEALREQYLIWQRKLAEAPGPFIDGEAPGSRDLMLFGGIQCHASIRVAPIRVLQSDPQLQGMRDWIATMQEHFAGYPHLYSGIYFPPYSDAPAKTSAVERLVFWLGSAITLLGAPITVPLAIYYARRVRRLDMVNPRESQIGA